MVMVSAVYVCNLTASAPATAAARTMASARSILPLWLADSSAIIYVVVLSNIFNVLYAYTDISNNFISFS